uniref:Protein kinase domain-containing protein n=1 Tax=viral metagenome TaxID=1070528 RepID=A0A6C0AD74_9ZZZZ
MEIERIKKGIYNFKYISNDYFYNDFLLISFIKEGFIKIINEMLNLNPELINYVSEKNKDNILLAALRHKNYELAKYLILNTDINLNYTGENNLNAFSWSCFNNEKDISILLLDKEPYILDIPGFFLSKDLEFQRIISKKIIGLKIKPLDKKFKFYSEKNFTFIRKLSSGNYGESILAIDENNEKVVIKKFESCVGTDSVKEFYFLKLLNHSEISPNLRGIYIKGDCVYLVMECLKYTIYDFFRLLDCCSEKNELTIKYYFKKVLKTISKIHDFGIVHNDLNVSNIMLNYENKIKIIDFGMAEFFGIKPILSDFFDRFDISNFYPPDFYNLKTITLKINSKDKTFEINRKSYVSDIFYVGSIFLILYTGNTIPKLFVEDDIYTLEGTILDFNRKQIWEKYHSEGWFKNLMRNMICINSLERMTARELLNLDWNIYSKKNINGFSNKNVLYIDNSILETFNIKKILSKYENLKFPRLGFIRFPDGAKSLIKAIISNDKSLDSFISAIIEHRKSKGPLQNLLNFFEILQSSKNLIIKNLEVFNENVVFYPITSYIQYIVINLKNNKLEVETYLTENIIKYVLFSQEHIDITVLEILQLIYLTKYRYFNFLTIKKNNLNYKKIEEVIKNSEEIF